MRQILSSLFLFLSMAVISQSRLQNPEIYVGFTGGATGSGILFSPSVSQKYLKGYNGGAVFRYIGDKNVGLQAELNYFQRGWKESSGLFSKQLNYVEFPFLTHIYIGNNSRFFINLGPKVGYLISEKILSNQTINSTEVQHITPTQNRFDYGLCGGIGLQFNIGKQLLQMETRCYYGLSDIYSNNQRDYFDASNHLNISVNLGWMIRVK